MTEKHHPASSRATRTQMERGQRRQNRRALSAQASGAKKQSRAFKQPTGFARGARIRGQQ